MHVKLLPDLRATIRHIIFLRVGIAGFADAQSPTAKPSRKPTWVYVDAFVHHDTLSLALAQRIKQILRGKPALLRTASERDIDYATMSLDEFRAPWPIRDMWEAGRLLRAELMVDVQCTPLLTGVAGKAIQHWAATSNSDTLAFAATNSLDQLAQQMADRILRTALSRTKR